MSDSEIIARRRAEFALAFNREDISALSDLITEDNVAMPPNRPELRGKGANIAFWRGGFAVAESRVSITPGELEVQGDVAFDRFRYVMESAPKSGGDVMRDEGKNIWLWRRQDDGAWRIARAIWNSDLSQGQTVWTGAGSSASALPAADREKLRDLIERRWVAAGLAHDSGAMAAMCAEDVEYFPPDQPSFVGRAAVQAFFETFPPMVRFTQSLGGVEGDTNRAVARCRFAVAFDVAGKVIENTGKFICSFEKQASGDWLVKYCGFNFDRLMATASGSDLGASIRAANDDLLTKGNIARAHEIFSPDYMVHFNGEVLRGTQAIEQYVTELRSAFPDLRYEIEILASAGDKVSWVRTHHAAHTGNFMGVPPSGRSITWRDSVVSRYEGNRIAEEWAVTDIGDKLSALDAKG